MKLLENARLQALTAFLSQRRLGERVLDGRAEAFSCKRAGEDKKLAKEQSKGDRDRILRRFNMPVMIKLVLHEHAYAEGRTGEEYRMVEVSDSIRLDGLLELARHPEAAEILRADPERWKRNAAEEVLRMRPGFYAIGKKAVHDDGAEGGAPGKAGLRHGMQGAGADAETKKRTAAAGLFKRQAPPAGHKTGGKGKTAE